MDVWLVLPDTVLKCFTSFYSHDYPVRQITLSLIIEMSHGEDKYSSQVKPFFKINGEYFI